MIIDINAFLGHYPFRQVRYTTAADMVAQMDRHGIDAALVSPLHAMFYRDAQRGNEELIEAIRPHRDRLFPVGVVNPLYAGWQRDLRWLAKAGGIKAVLLAPEYHAYRLTDETIQPPLAEIAELQLPVVLVQRLEDRRQRHHWDVAEDMAFADVAAVAKSHPALKLAFVNWLGLSGEKLLAAGLRGRCLIDFARQHVVLNKDVPKLIEALGPESIAFGTHMPFDYPAASLVKLSNIRELLPDALDAVSWKNANTFFALGLNPTNRPANPG